MEPKIQDLKEICLIGMCKEMSFSNIQTRELWQSFMPRRKDIKNSIGMHLFSVEIYNEVAFFEEFDPSKKFQKWAAVEVENFDIIPEDFETLSIPSGKYVVFNYKGKESEAADFYKYILTVWIPNSKYTLDTRPHFAVMGEKYINEDPASEEELWFPVKEK